MKKARFLLYVVVFFCMGESAFAQFDEHVVTNDADDQNETTVAYSPVDPNILLAAWNDLRVGGARCAFSTDGGNNWIEQLIPGQRAFDPSTAFGRDGRAFYCYMAWTDAVVSRTSNLGVEWLTSPVGSGAGQDDKPYIAVDNSGHQGTDGNIYVSWMVHIGHPDNTVTYLIKFSRSTNSGSTFSETPVTLDSVVGIGSEAFRLSPDYDYDPSTAAFPLVTLTMPAVGPSGELYVIWAFVPGIGGNSSYFKIVKSTDGGLTFVTLPSPAWFTFWREGQPTLGRIDITNVPSLAVDPVTGYLYLSFADPDEAPDLRLKFVWSTNGGNSWEQFVNIANFDFGWQFFPWVSVDKTGRVSVAFMHSPNPRDQSNHVVASYLVESYDRGVSFTAPVQVSSVQSNPDSSRQKHHYMGAAARLGGKANILWADYRNQGRLSDPYFSHANTNLYWVGQNKSTTPNATWSNSARHLAKSGSKLHEVFTSLEEILYRQSPDNGNTWEKTTMLSQENGGNSTASITVAHDGSLHIAWQRMKAPSTFEVWYSRSTDYGSSWASPIVLPSADNVAVSFWQAGGAMPVIAELGSIYKLVVVYVSQEGLRYRTSSDNGATWIIPSPGIISGLHNYLAWYPSLASGGSFLSLTYDYRLTESGLYSRTYSGTTWTDEKPVADVTGTVYNRHSSVAVDPDGHPLTAWCAQKYDDGQLDVNYRIVFRHGNSDNSWNSWFVEFAKIPGVHSFYPSITYYTTGMINPYGINIIHHTQSQSSSASNVRLKKYEVGNGWSDIQLTNKLTPGAWANCTLESQTSGIPVNMWTGQNGVPYSLVFSSQYLPKMLASGETSNGRRVVVQHRQTKSFIAFQIDSLRLALSDGSEVSLAFMPHDFRQPLNLTLSNVWDFLGTEAVQLPANTLRLLFNKSVYFNPTNDTSGHGTPISFPLRQFRFRIVDPNGGGVLATLDTSSNSGTVSVNIASVAGRNVIFRPAVTLSGIQSQQVALGVGDIIYFGNEQQNAMASKDQPQGYVLSQNYPNPFNPLTIIRYNVPTEGQVSLTVFDVLGREVATLVDEFKLSGSYTATFDASKLASGVYFYRLKEGGLTDVKRMVVAK